MIEQLRLIWEAMLFYKKELLGILVTYCFTQMISFFWNKLTFDKTTVYTQTSITSKTNLFHFKLKHPKITPNNTVYSTPPFNDDGYTVVLKHSVYALYLYYKDLLNTFNLMVSIGQMYYFYEFRSVIPLTVFTNLFIISHLISIIGLLKQQMQTNNAKIEKLYEEYGKLKSKKIKQKQLRRGDLVRLSSGDIPPADILLINLEATTLMTQEIQLSGEDIVLQKSGLNVVFDKSRYEITINHHKNNGHVTDMKAKDTQNQYYTEQNIAFCGTKVEDGNMIGIVLETGNDCAIYRNDNSVRKSKTSIQKMTDNTILSNLKLLLLFAAILSFVILYTEMLAKKHFWYYLIQMILLFNMIVPLSLPFFSHHGAGILSRRIANLLNVKINSHGRYVFHYDPDEIVSDKTGTLTTNVLELIDIFYDSKTVMANPNFEILLNILACTTVQPHSKTGELLKNDVLEEKLLTHICQKMKMMLIYNKFEYNGTGELLIGETKVNRRFYKSFDYELEVKLSVIEYKERLFLHIQGTPEAIDKYSGKRLSDSKVNQMIEDLSKPSNAYRRIIAHASKEIDEKDLQLLKDNPKLVLANMQHVSVYLFYDYMVKDVEKSVQAVSENRCFTMLTGDKMSSAVEIGKLLGITSNGVLVIETLEDIMKEIRPEQCLILNGRLLDTLISSERVDQLIHLIKNSKRRIIYRATPTSKQKVVSLFQKQMKRTVMMVGDGSNDVPAMFQADVSIGVIGENKSIQNIAEIVIDNWNKIVLLLREFKEKRVIVMTMLSWLLMRSMMSAFQLLSMFMHSKFQKYKDPMNPLFSTLNNGILFLCMMNYCNYECIPLQYQNFEPKMRQVLVKGALLGFIYGWIFFTIFDINTAISLLTIVQVLHLIFELYNKIHSKSWIIKRNFMLIIGLFGLLNVAVYWINNNYVFKTKMT